MTLKLLTELERDLILSWRNAPEVCRQMYTRHSISPEEHRAWFERMQADPGAHWYLYYDSSGEPVGVVYFTDIDSQARTAYWVFYTRPGGAPAGTGTRILYAALEHAFNELCLHKLNGEVLATNTTSLHLHEQFGFTRKGTFREQHFDGEQYVDIIRFGLLAREWPEHRERLQSRIKQLDALASQREGECPPPPRKIVMLSEPGSWINAYLPDLMEEWEELGHKVDWSHDPHNVGPADFCFCLGLGQMVSCAVREQYRHTLVVHESDLPRGRGWSPLTWQVLEGASRITVTLFEAVDDVDAGPIYLQDCFYLEGHELIEELRALQAESTRSLCRRFVDKYPEPVKLSRKQMGEPDYYPRRTPLDSELNPETSLAEQFNLLRVVDNERYPAFFSYRGRRYRLRVEPDI